MPTGRGSSEGLPDDVTMDDRSTELAMLALQGPAALTLVELPELPPFGFTRAEVAGVPAIVARTGYTGEPGVELICEPEHAGPLWDALLAAGATPCGLGARDTLRLEVCYPLYGNDLSLERTALEAGLGWVCALDAKDFVGAAALRSQRDRGDYDRLVAFRMTDRAHSPPGDGDQPGRRGDERHHVAFAGHRASAWATCRPRPPMPGTPIEIDVRGRPAAAEVAKKPLYVKEHTP